MFVVREHRVLLDDVDAPLWHAHTWGVYGDDLMYVTAKDGVHTLYLHRMVLSAPAGVEVDHRNGDGLDNRRANLRLAPHRLNLANQRKQVGRTSSFKGVYWDAARGRWAATIKVDGRSRGLGRYDDERVAAAAYDAAAVEAWGEFARLNLVDCGA